MNIKMRAAPDINLVIHVVEVRRVAAVKSRCQRGGPRLTVHTVPAGAGLAAIVKQREICISGIGSKLRSAVRLETVTGVAVVLIRAALRAILSDRKTPVSVARGRSARRFRTLRHPWQHHHRHQRIAVRTLHVCDPRGRTAYPGLRRQAAESVKGIVLE